MANIRDVAKHANVSIATVSKILSHDSEFSATEETKKRVLDAAEELNYVYRSRKRNIKIGVIMPRSYEYFSDPYFGGILQSIETFGTLNNIELALVIMSSDLIKDIHIADQSLAKVEGLIIMDELKEEQIHHLETIVENIVVVDFFDGKHCSVGFNEAYSTLAIMNHLISSGYEKIAFVGGSTERTPLKHQINFMMYRESLLNESLPYNEAYVKDCHWDVDECTIVTRELLRMENRPEAIFVANDYLASVTLGVIYAENLNCPKDIGVVGFNDIKTAEHFVPPLTTVSVPTDELGIVAIKRLVDLINDKDTQVYHVDVPFKLIIRESTRRLK